MHKLSSPSLSTRLLINDSPRGAPPRRYLLKVPDLVATPLHRRAPPNVIVHPSLIAAHPCRYRDGRGRCGGAQVRAPRHPAPGPNRRPRPGGVSGCVCGVGGPCGTLVPAARYLRYLVPDTLGCLLRCPAPSARGLKSGRTSLESSIAPSPLALPPPRCVSFRPALSSLILAATNVAPFNSFLKQGTGTGTEKGLEWERQTPAQISAHMRGAGNPSIRIRRIPGVLGTNTRPTPRPVSTRPHRRRSLSLFPACATSPLLCLGPAYMPPRTCAINKEHRGRVSPVHLMPVCRFSLRQDPPPRGGSSLARDTCFETLPFHRWTCERTSQLTAGFHPSARGHGIEGWDTEAEGAGASHLRPRYFGLRSKLSPSWPLFRLA